ncbi:ent-kaurene oxidase [Niveomyces insectorum RCEF 264]|uniref:Ent-kaurene oxidase n=1 Tax=Niveomyces insectorum RCEF 264 TaxID=1081102 RepID=A0A167W2T5_9HYPO|nr:ent-kaurene oxidase [Niveomyces insectorum RCEF 264]
MLSLAVSEAKWADVDQLLDRVYQAGRKLAEADRTENGEEPPSIPGSISNSISDLRVPSQLAPSPPNLTTSPSYTALARTTRQFSLIATGPYQSMFNLLSAAEPASYCEVGSADSGASTPVPTHGAKAESGRVAALRDEILDGIEEIKDEIGQADDQIAGFAEGQIRPGHDSARPSARYIHLFPCHHNTRIANSVVKQELTRSLTKINLALSRAVADTVATEMPACDDWAPVNINEVLLRMVAIISGHVFVGPELCRRPEYLDAAVHFTTDITMAVPIVKRWTRLVRPLAKYFEPQLAKVEAHRARMREFLRPVIAERQARRARGEPVPEDTLQWMLDKTDAEGITDVAELTNMQLLLTMAAIHTMTLTTSFILHDMVACPDVVEACRREIRDVLAASPDGSMSTHALFNMKLVDSVMRESQRLNPLFLDAFRWYTLKLVTLRDGTYIPAGCLIEAANKAVLMDPVLYPNPTVFDPYRFVRLRTDPAAPDPLAYKNREQYQFVSVTKENMSIGFGRHACPGRFFAANEIKLILANQLLNFDLKLAPEGEGGPAKDVVLGSGVGPDPSRVILFRKARA